MIKVTNQEEFEKCLPMLDSPDVECRLLGWQLLHECTDLRKDAALVIGNTKYLFRSLIIRREFLVYCDDYGLIKFLYSRLIKDFTTKSKIFGGKTYITLRNGRTSQ